MEGRIRVGDKVRFMASDAEYEVLECGVRTPKEVKKDSLECGEVGWLWCVNQIHSRCACR